MLNGKVALVTGTTSWDLGSMIALALAKNGADIALNLSPADPNRAEILKPRLSELCTGQQWRLWFDNLRYRQNTFD
jgi:NAD(P)-dependent dehydrogenase (short-subunit alcohol dehydrogenase family)